MIDFPASPVAGQLFFASNGIVYQYSGTYASWVAISASAPQDGSFYVEGTGAVWAPSLINTWETANPGTLRTGNVGGWYNSATGVFTPPAGRYYLFGSLAFDSSASNMQGQLRWRKNGAVILTNFDTVMNTAGASLFATVQSQILVDANGTDTFDLQVQGNVLMSQAWGYMGAFAVNQAVVPIGGGSSWRQIARTVLGGAQATLDFQNIPTDINDIELRFDMSPVTNGVNALLRWYDGTGALKTSGYGWQNSVVGNSAAVNTPSVATTNTSTAYSLGILLNYDGATARVSNLTLGGIRGAIRWQNIRDAARAKSCNFQIDYLTDNAATLEMGWGGGWIGNAHALTGVQLSFSSGNIAAGGTATLWGSP